MITLYLNKENCCGCSACKNICPKDAINMECDTEGFLYPKIDEELCIECELCEKVCRFKCKDNDIQSMNEPIVYAVKHKLDEVRLLSSSGGMFTAMSDWIINKGGLVFGAAFDEKFNVIHKSAETLNERDKFRGSKYVQSDLKETFGEVKDQLILGKMVLFTGTPCQTDGLKSYLVSSKISSERLYLCDIVCHGTPSPLMWKEHIKLSEKKCKSEMHTYNCRSKIKGWHGHNELSVFKNGKIDYSSNLSQKHKELFYAHLILRPSCHNCKYTNFNRETDITIADFWGIEKTMKEYDDNKGISLVLVNTEKGKEIFRNCSENLDYRISNTVDCSQPNLQKPSVPSPKRGEFWCDYYENGYIYIAKKYAGYGIVNNAKSLIGRAVNKVIRIIN